MQEKKPKVLLLGWDAADWKMIQPLLDKGWMPNLKAFMEEGSYGDLKTLSPPFSPMLWSSIATGVRADSHGVLGFMESNASNTAPQPVRVNSRKYRALWNILSFAGYRTNVINWWPSYPVEPVNGIYISEHFCKIETQTLAFSKSKNFIHPKHLAGELSKYRITPFELAPEHIYPFVPNLKDVDQEKDGRLSSVAKVFTEGVNTFSSLTWALDQADWDFTAAYFPEIDHFGHGFMKYHPPRQPQIREEDFNLYNNVITAAYRYHDMMLGNLLKKLDSDTTVILCSDHGFHPDQMRPKYLPVKIEPAAPAREHSDHGIIIIRGPGIKKNNRLFGTSLLDITPTICSLFKIPLSKEFEGVVIDSAFESKQEASYIDSWQEVEGDFFEIKKNEESKESEGKEGMQNLKALGYVADDGDERFSEVEKVEIEQKYNLALVKIEKGEINYAIDLLKQLSYRNRKSSRFLYLLWKCYFKNNDLDNSDKTLKKLSKLTLVAPSNLALLRAKTLYSQGNTKLALKLLIQIEKKGKQPFRVYRELLNIRMKLKNWEKVFLIARKAIKYNPKDSFYYYCIGVAFFHIKKHEKSLNYLFKSLELNSLSENAHFYIGENLFHTERYEEAIQAYLTVVKLDPDYLLSYRRMKKIHQDFILDKEKVKEYGQIIKFRSKGEIIIVTGLPRSGTSLMMQIIDQMGVEVFTDQKRTPDDNNPQGYYEHESVKNLMTKNNFLKEAVGKVVKVVAPLLNTLPDNYKFKIVFMDRDVKEIIQSQYKMMEKGQENVPMGLEFQYQKEIKKALRLLQTRKNISYLRVNYNEIIHSPEKSIKKVAKFLAYKKSTKKLEQVVNPDLYRNRRPVS